MASGANKIATGAVTVNDTVGGVQIVPVRTGRRAITLLQPGTTAVFIGNSGVATTTGISLTGTAGTTRRIETTAAIYGITASGSQSIQYLEEYDE